METCPGGGNYPAGVANTIIQSGEAFLVHATSTGNVTLSENSKTSGSALVFRPADDISELPTNLIDSTAKVADGNVIVFDNAYSDSVDGNDALKLFNSGENLGILRSNKTLVIEARKPGSIYRYYFLLNE
ncbi:MAG: hypothetical protein WDM71_06170 [Ferruginibacter sp.]